MVPPFEGRRCSPAPLRHPPCPTHGRLLPRSAPLASSVEGSHRGHPRSPFFRSPEDGPPGSARPPPPFSPAVDRPACPPVPAHPLPGGAASSSASRNRFSSSEGPATKASSSSLRSLPSHQPLHKTKLAHIRHTPQ
ncbi:unnamed protein product [Prunus armeniaca]